ncbi:phosphate propanoyltransferase [Paenibacillus sp. E194]|jgi:putative phosphotransacetylase|uniref:Phosphate propanoyltransferase n=1 Tax=Paenibacillus alvei TS-15 TaxID=1117108 RepID=S9SS96_PAEAL|nr:MULTISPECIES: phosphate propanoyltransferase [Paenibacillus]EPY07554.1 propanediol utilization phosphotransacylase [Paenibacillus alvei TS-15]KJB85214.1 phosphate propanoyltransferase [Paenibacillus sp. E194]
MGNYDQVLSLLMEVVSGAGKAGEEPSCIPLGISNRHVHLSQADVETLFGSGYTLSKLRDLSQPGQYACNETVTVCGPKGAIEKVRVLGPVRKQSQVEIMRGDCFKLGVKAPVRLSGELEGTPGVTLIGSKGSVYITCGLMVAQRHIHMTPDDALFFGVTDGEMVSIQFDGLRGGGYNQVAIRVGNDAALDCHIDVEEANAMDLTSASIVQIIKNR